MAWVGLTCDWWIKLQSHSANQISVPSVGLPGELAISHSQVCFKV